MQEYLIMKTFEEWYKNEFPSQYNIWAKGNAVSKEVSLAIQHRWACWKAFESAKKEMAEYILNPRVWDENIHDAWHKSIPDTQKAFEGLRKIFESS